MRRSASPWIWPALIICSALLASLSVVVTTPAPFRQVLVLWFLLVCPGMAYVRLLRLAAFTTELAVAIGLSLSLELVLALAMLYRGSWSPSNALGILVSFTLLGATLQLLVGGPMVQDGPRSTPAFYAAWCAAASRAWRALRAWLRAHDTMLTNASSMVGATALTSGLGFGYWWVAARAASVTSVGLAAAAISAMMLLATVSMMGFGTLLIGELPQRAERKLALLSAAALVSGTSGLGLGFLFAALSAWVAPDLGVLSASPRAMISFACGTAVSTILLLLDNALIGLLRGDVQLWRNGLHAGAKIALLLAAIVLRGEPGWFAIYLAWVASGILSLAVLLWPGKGRARWAELVRPDWRALARLRGQSAAHFCFNLALQLPTLLLPVVVTALLSADVNAGFYIAFMISGVLFIIPAALTTVLFAIAKGQPAAMVRQLRLSLTLSFTIGTVAVAITVLAAGWALSMFGPHYAAEAAWCLRIFTLGVLPLTIKAHYVAVCRIQGRVGRAAWVAGAGALSELSLASAGAIAFGLIGLSLGWLVAAILQALIMGLPVYRASRYSALDGRG